jgi:hypothetical protein
MRQEEFVMRGQTASGSTEVLNFSGFKPGYAYRLVQFDLYPSNPVGDNTVTGTITAGKTGISPSANVSFKEEGLIATTMEAYNTGAVDGTIILNIINDTFLITQNLILMVENTVSGNPVNWQCKFMPVKMTKAEEAVTNYKQFMISDE